MPKKHSSTPLPGEQPAVPQPTPGPAGRWPASPWLATAVIAIAAVAVYANGLGGPFVFDDNSDIVENTSIRHLWPPWRAVVAHAKGKTYLCTRPVANLSFALDYALGGLHTLPYHLTNVAVHLAAGLLLFGIVRRTLLLPRLQERFGPAATPLALTAALLWTVHPLNTQAVTYVVQRYESLMGMFYSWPYTRRSVAAPRQNPPAGRRSRSRRRSWPWVPRRWPSRCRS